MISHRLAIACLLMLPACDVLSPYEEPAGLAAPEQWGETENTGNAADTWPDAQWWKNFGSAELIALMQEATSNNDDLAAAVARVAQADAQVSVSGAPLLPIISASQGATRALSPNKSSSTRAAGTFYSAGASASYEIDFWGKNRSYLESAEALRDASAYDRQTVFLTVTASVANTYFDILATQARLDVARKNLTAAEELLAAIQRRFEQGMVSRLDVVQQENTAAVQRATIAPLELRLTQDRNALAILLARLPESMPDIEGDWQALNLPEFVQGIPSELLTRRPDVQVAEANLIAAHADINAARAAFFPSISLSLGTDFASSTLSKLLSPASQLITLGESAVQPIFQGGTLSGQLGIAKARQEELLSNYHKVVVNAFADVENALANVRRSAEAETAQAEAEQSARIAFVLSQRQLRGGTVDITTVLNTQRSYFAATDAYVQARLARLQAMVGLYQALGGGWKKEELKN